MLLSPDDAELFFKLHRSLMCFVNERLQIIPDIGSPNEFAALPPEARLEVRRLIPAAMAAERSGPHALTPCLPGGTLGASPHESPPPSHRTRVRTGGDLRLHDRLSTGERPSHRGDAQ